MDRGSFSELLSYQMSKLKLLEFKNELATMLALANDQNTARRRRTTRAWLSGLKDQNDPKDKGVEEAIQQALRLREDGNALYTSSKGATTNKKMNLIIAGQRYTQAIFRAPPNSEALALAYANRAMILQDLEYYQQAYDDCCCALETGKYPKRLLHKIQTRQAFCALYLKDATKLAEHLVELEEVILNENFARNLEELRIGLKKLSIEEIGEVKEQCNNECATTEATEIIDSNDPIRGRYMIATRQIKSGEVIFSEAVNAFVPVGGSQMCTQCGVMLFIPIPCHSCNGRVIYCSLKCRNANAHVHQIECLGHLWGLFDMIGISFLALRVILEELPAVQRLVEAANKTGNVRDIWFNLTTPSTMEFQLNTENNRSYIRTLNMVTHLSKMALADICNFALVADLLLIYLKDYTKFFYCLNDTQLEQTDWELIISALILRHVGQFIVNAHTCVSITPTCFDVSLTSSNAFVPVLLMPGVWSKPHHLSRGMLHIFSRFSEVSVINLPYLSICNHACAPTLRHKFSSKHFYALASGDVEKGVEIFNCYAANYQNSLRDDRRDYLESIYHFKCTCVYCERENPDADYLKLHLYKCQNPNCQKQFVPTATLNWWHTDNESDSSWESIACPHCAKKQNFKWYQKFQELLNQTSKSEKRKELFRILEMMDGILLELHALKIDMGIELIRSCMDSYMTGSKFTEAEMDKIVETAKFCLTGSAIKYGIRSIVYVACMTFLWDLIALNCCKMSQFKKADMLKALDILSDEYRLVFLNYYRDYMQSK